MLLVMLSLVCLAGDVQQASENVGVELGREDADGISF